jgi:hypothetical protein
MSPMGPEADVGDLPPSVPIRGCAFCVPAYLSLPGTAALHTLDNSVDIISHLGFA